MPAPETYLDYTGAIDCEKINSLLHDLKGSPDFGLLDKTTGKRLYSIVVECAENIMKYSWENVSANINFVPYIKALNPGNKIIVEAGNIIRSSDSVNLTARLMNLNSLDEAEITSLYEETIRRKPSLKEKGAGLGIILIRLKSGNNLDYHFTEINREFSFFEIKIAINKFIMRKLIFDKTDSSPKVIFDPDNNIFEICGESRPSDAGSFYGEILRWGDDFSNHLLNSGELNKPVVFNFDLEYFNSSSAKYILDFCKQIASIKSRTGNIEARWIYEEDDADMLEAGKEMSRIAKLPFEYISK